MPTHDPHTITAATDLAPHVRTVVAATLAAVIAAVATRRTHAE